MGAATDAELAVAGEPAAFGTLFERHARAVYNYCFRRTADWSLAEDLTSIVFLEAWRRREEVRLDRDSALPWLLGVATNVVRNRWRSERRHRAALDRLPREGLGDFTEAADARLDDERRMRDALRLVARLGAVGVFPSSGPDTGGRLGRARVGIRPGRSRSAATASAPSGRVRLSPSTASARPSGLVPGEPLVVTCYASPELPAPFVRADADGRDPVAICTELWRKGELGGSERPATACLLHRSSVGVFPGPPAICRRLGPSVSPLDETG